MADKWKSIENLRETSIKISEGSYSEDFVKSRNISDKCISRYYNQSEKPTTVFVPEPIKVRLNENGELEYQELEICFRGGDYKEKFETSAGVFISNNRGEFGGELITPRETIRGNFIEVFECDKIIYAIDSLNHLGYAHTKIYSFSKKLHHKIVYSSEDIKLGSWEDLSFVDFKALCIKTDKVYVLVSELSRKNDVYFKKSHLFEIKKGIVVNTIEFDYYFSSVTNMVINEGKMILGMDKVIAIVDLETKKIKAYTPVSIESEIDILENNDCN